MMLERPYQLERCGVKRGGKFSQRLSVRGSAWKTLPRRCESALAFPLGQPLDGRNVHKVPRAGRDSHLEFVGFSSGSIASGRSPRAWQTTTPMSELVVGEGSGPENRTLGSARCRPRHCCHRIGRHVTHPFSPTTLSLSSPPSCTSAGRYHE